MDWLEGVLGVFASPQNLEGAKSLMSVKWSDSLLVGSALAPSSMAWPSCQIPAIKDCDIDI